MLTKIQKIFNIKNKKPYFFKNFLTKLFGYVF